LSIAGGAVMFGGAIPLTLAALRRPSLDPDDPRDDNDFKAVENQERIGTAMMIAGGVGAAVGIALTVTGLVLHKRYDARAQRAVRAGIAPAPYGATASIGWAF